MDYIPFKLKLLLTRTLGKAGKNNMATSVITISSGLSDLSILTKQQQQKFVEYGYLRVHITTAVLLHLPPD